MVEVYSDISWIAWHERFARDQQDIEAFRKQYHIPPSGERIIGIQTKILDIIPKYPAISMLMQTHVRKSWARFEVPANYFIQRPFTSHIAPSLGPPEKQDADIAKIENYLRQETKTAALDLLSPISEEEEETIIREGKKIASMLKGVKESNELIDDVKARMNQFIQV